jgi:hypothetical protein
VLNLAPDGALPSGEEPEKSLYSGTRLELKAPSEERLVGKANSEQGAASKATRRQGSRAQVSFAATLFGLQGTEFGFREQLATVLALTVSLLVASAEKWARARRGAWRREAVLGVREQLTKDGSLLARLLEAGRLAGLWGRAFGVRAEDGEPYPLWNDNRT